VFDNNGNAQTKVVGTNTTIYAWDFENRLTSVTLPGGGGTVTFAYDPFGRRIKKVTSTTTSIFAYDGDNLVEETNSSGAAVARYEPTQNIDEPLAMLRSGATSYFHADGLGSVTSLSNAAGSIANTYTYDSFGKLTASTGSLVNPFQYTARESDTETGLYYYRARYYDQSTLCGFVFCKGWAPLLFCFSSLLLYAVFDFAFLLLVSHPQSLHPASHLDLLLLSLHPYLPVFSTTYHSVRMISKKYIDTHTTSCYSLSCLSTPILVDFPILAFGHAHV